MTPDDRKLLQEVHDAVTRLTPLVEKHEKDLNGNGQIGLKEKVTLIQTKQAECPARSAMTNAGKSNTIAIGSLVVALAAVVKSFFCMG